jgi:uncharacterized tellurite resistance protein B-like protein
MLNSISAFFERCLKPDEDNSPDASAGRLHLACAALLLELGTADNQLDADERRTLMQILQKQFGLGPAALDELWKMAQAQRQEATDLYQFTRLINDHYGYGEKCTLLGHLWDVAYADGRIDRYEEHLIRKIADLLYLSHGDFIRAKLASKPAE